MTSGGNNSNNFPENQLTKSRAVYTAKANRGSKFVVIRLRRTLVEWRWSQKDGPNWCLFTAHVHAHLLNRKAAALHFTRVYTVCTIGLCNYEILAKKHSLPYQSNSNVFFFQHRRPTIYRENWYHKSLGVRRPPVLLNDAPGNWIGCRCLTAYFANAMQRGSNFLKRKLILGLFCTQRHA